MRKSKKIFILFTVICLAWIFLLARGKKADVPELELTLASTIYFISCLPLIIYFLRSQKTVPYLPIFGIVYFTYFGLSIFNDYELFRLEALSPDSITKALYLALFGFISLLVGFYSPCANIIRLMFKPLKIPWDYRKAYRVGLFIGGLGIIVYYCVLAKLLPSALGGVLGFAADLPRLAIAILYMLQSQNKLDFKGKIFLWLGLFTPKIFLAMSTGATLSIISDFLILLVISFYQRRSIPWAKTAVAFAIFFVIFSARNDFRSLAWFEGEYANRGPLDKGALYVKLIYQKITGSEEYHRTTYEQLSARTDYLVTFAKVAELTPAYIPFWGGYTYSTLATSLIPRFIMPSKLPKTLGQDFGQRYMFLSPQDYTTSYNLSMFIEMYVNFGITGVIVGMFILGIIFRILYILLNHPEAGEGGLILSTMIFINLLNIESDFSLIFGTTIQYIILFYIILRMARLQQRGIFVQKADS